MNLKNYGIDRVDTDAEVSLVNAIRTVIPNATHIYKLEAHDNI